MPVGGSRRYGRDMATDPRAALDEFVRALQRHFDAAAGRVSELDPAVVAAYDELASAFVAYDDVLFDAFDEVTPFDLTEDDDDDDDDDDEPEDDELEDDDQGDDDDGPDQGDGSGAPAPL